MDSVELKQFRKQYRWSQSELASRLGCSVRSIANWESGKNAIPESIALAVSAVALNLPRYGVKSS